jgi:hypothetical protein
VRARETKGFSGGPRWQLAAVAVSRQGMAYVGYIYITRVDPEGVILEIS